MGFYTVFDTDQAKTNTLQGNPTYVFLFWELCCLSPNFHIHVSVSDLYVYSRISPYIFLQQKSRPILEIYKSLTDI
jgi:hypothetical protein